MYVCMYVCMCVCKLHTNLSRDQFPPFPIIRTKKFPVRRKRNRNPEVCRVCTFTDISSYAVHTYTDIMYLPYNSFRNRDYVATLDLLFLFELST